MGEYPSREGFAYYNMLSIFPWIIETIPLMPRLETLKLSDVLRRTLYQSKDVPTLRSQTLKHFVTTENVNTLVDMPRLQSFDGPLLVLDRHDDSLQHLAVPSLKHLIIRNARFRTIVQSIARDCTIIRLLPPIETMIWKDELYNAEMFIAICESCTTLTDLRFTKDIRLYDMSVLSHLAKLSNLRSLSVGYVLTRSPIHFDFSQLTTLEKLAIDESAVETLILPESLKSLQLVIDKDNERTMIEAILSRSLQLIELVVYCVNDDSGKDMTMETKKILPQLPNLKIHKFHSAQYEKPPFYPQQDLNDRQRMLRRHKNRITQFQEPKTQIQNRITQDKANRYGHLMDHIYL
ncbi:uncharacterized protein LOC126578240 isoform X2 [Anopheles aquasalis]|uniref:uncharacterized protein LOC126578240 isoform X2 n=1 Tax=Anopheles aquasalis TaxID=42839 RepID=UPI00215B0A91|nr:uncharacterized protein LOC126578240 isoform X2 [Anopheles aquasalis]